MRKGLELVVVSMIGFQSVASADSTSSVTFEEIAADAAFIGVFEVSGSPEPASGEDCGHWIDVRVKERLAGPDAPSRILVENVDDLLAEHNRYLVFAFHPTEARLAACALSRDSLVVPAAVQVMFPFGEQRDRTVDDLELLAWRHSAFSVNGYYFPNEFVYDFAVLNDRLYAVIRWQAVRTKLLEIR